MRVALVKVGTRELHWLRLVDVSCTLLDWFMRAALVKAGT
jgi:hypothetical protein